MGLRRSYLPWLLTAAVGGVAIPAFAYGDPAPPTTATIHAFDLGVEDPSTGDTTVTIAASVTVNFSHPPERPQPPQRRHRHDARAVTLKR